MSFGLVLLLVGGFLLGGVWSVWNAGTDGDATTAGRTPGQLFAAGVLLVAALLATVAGILWMVG